MNLLVTGAFSWTENELNKFRQLGHEVVFMQQEKSSLPCDASWVEGIIGNGIFLSHPIEQFTSLRFIQLTSAGFDRVPMDYIEKRGITIYNARGVYSIPMAEFAIAGVLQLYKQMNFFEKNQKQHRWEKHRGLLELYGKTVCIVGCGSVGTECAKKFSAFDCNIVGVDLVDAKNEFFQEIVTIKHLNEVLPCCDVVVLTVPLTNDTYHLLNEERLSLLKKTAVLVNIARGAIIDTKALISRLPDIGGTVLDVFEEEPLPQDNILWDLENVIITPHNSFGGDGCSQRLDDLVISNLREFGEIK